MNTYSLSDNISYQAYVLESLNTNIEYANYISEQLDVNIRKMLDREAKIDELLK